MKLHAVKITALLLVLGLFAGCSSLVITKEMQQTFDEDVAQRIGFSREQGLDYSDEAVRDRPRRFSIRAALYESLLQSAKDDFDKIKKVVEAEFGSEVRSLFAKIRENERHASKSRGIVMSDLARLAEKIIAIRQKVTRLDGRFGIGYPSQWGDGPVPRILSAITKLMYAIDHEKSPARIQELQLEIWDLSAKMAAANLEAGWRVAQYLRNGGSVHEARRAPRIKLSNVIPLESIGRELSPEDSNSIRKRLQVGEVWLQGVTYNEVEEAHQRMNRFYNGAIKVLRHAVSQMKKHTVTSGSDGDSYSLGLKIGAIIEEIAISEFPKLFLTRELPEKEDHASGIILHMSSAFAEEASMALHLTAGLHRLPDSPTREEANLFLKRDLKIPSH